MVFASEVAVHLAVVFYFSETVLADNIVFIEFLRFVTVKSKVSPNFLFKRLSQIIQIVLL